MDTPAAERERQTARADVLDDVALDAFVRAHYDRLTGLARLVCIDPGEAGDAVQAAFEQAWRRRATLQDLTALRSWLDRIVVREAIRQDRRRRSPLARFFGGPREIPMSIADPHAQQHEWMPALRIAYEQLPVEQRTAIALHLHFGYTAAETADLVGAPLETVRSRIRTGRQRLRRLLEDQP